MGQRKIYKTIWEEVAMELKNRILCGDIHQGERIKEAEIAEEFGISRGPIREAFRQLEQEGLIEYSSRKGCTVKTISAEDSAEYYVLRANLENLAVRMCQGKFSQNTMSEMEDLIKDMDHYKEAEDLLSIIDVDQKFHTLLVQECGMKKLFEMWSTLNNANAIIFYALYHTRFSPREQLARNHQLILDAMKSGNAEKICDIIQEHYLIVAHNLYRTESKEKDFSLDHIKI